MASKWIVLKRTTLLNTKYVKVYKEKIRLPNGKIIPDFTVVEKPSYVQVVATDSKNRIVTIKEYKHGAAKFQHALPAGMLDKPRESPLKAAKRELEEETGYVGGKFTYLGVLHEYASKDLHKIHVFRATNVRHVPSKQRLEDGETITEVNLLPISTLRNQIKSRKWDNASALCALVFSGILF